MNDLFGRLRSPRKRVMTARHIQLLNLLLDEGAMSVPALTVRAAHSYALKNPRKALLRDLAYLIDLEAMSVERVEPASTLLKVNLEWPTQITETEFFRRAKQMPKGKVYGFLSS